MHWLFPGGTHQQISLEISVKIQKKNCDAVYRTARGPEKLWATVRHICVGSVVHADGYHTSECQSVNLVTFWQRGTLMFPAGG